MAAPLSARGNPITPSSSLADAFTSHCKKSAARPETGKANYAIVQGEDELAPIGIASAHPERRPRLHRDLRPASADDGVYRPSYFAEIPP
jgi:hypothetical protein